MTAWATVVLAAVAVVSIVANVYLARATSRAAKEAQKSTANQETELGLLKRQLELAEKQFASAQDTARPKLRAAIISSGDRFTAGEVRFVHGSEPAYDVELWTRGTPAAGEAWGLRVGFVARLLTPGQTATFTAYPANADDQDHLPFERFLDGEAPPHGSVDVGLKWTRSDGTVDKLVERRPVAGPPSTDVDLFKA